MIIKQCWQLALVFFADYRYPATTGRGNQPIPGDITHFTPSINLPMKTLYMNPFPSAIDALLPNYQEPILITLKSSQKYFIHNQSYLPSDHAVAPAHWGVTMATSFVLINTTFTCMIVYTYLVKQRILMQTIFVFIINVYIYYVLYYEVFVKWFNLHCCCLWHFGTFSEFSLWLLFMLCSYFVCEL